MSDLLDAYAPSPNPLVIVISGSSGAGKDAVLKRMRAVGYPFHFVVTTTDRPPRPGEVHGQDYYFVSSAEFERMVAAGEMLEYARVYDQHKGIARAQVREALASGHDVVMRLDVQGATTIRRLAPEAVLIFLSCESEAALEARLRARGTETEETLRRRLALVSAEVQRLPDFDYLVINRTGELDATVETISAIIRAEKCRVRQRRVSL